MMMQWGMFEHLGETNLGNMSLFFSRYPVRDFWHISSCSWKKTMGMVTLHLQGRTGHIWRVNFNIGLLDVIVRT